MSELNFTGTLHLVSENFITFPNWEDGDFSPMLNFDMYFENQPKVAEADISELANGKYEVYLETQQIKASNISLLSINLHCKQKYKLSVCIVEKEQNGTDSLGLPELIEYCKVVYEYLRTNNQSK